MQHLTRKQIFEIYKLGPEAVADLFERLVSELEHIKDRVKTLEDQLAKDSHNSHKPPSSDGPQKRQRTKSLRQPTGKQAGGQVGHKGTTLEPVDKPDHTVVHKVERCRHCAYSLSDVVAIAYDKRQVFEIPPQQLEVTEHQAEMKACPKCHQKSVAVFPADVTHRTQYGPRFKAIAVYLLNQQLLPYERTAEVFGDIFSQPVSTGTLVNFNQSCFDSLASYEQSVKAKLIASEVGHFDETGMKINGQLHWLHCASTAGLTLYACHKKRGQEAMHALGILPDFQGTAVHDFWKAYLTYGCEHALCNTHNLRDLIFLDEQDNQQWAKEMIALLLKTKAQVEQNIMRLNQRTLREIEQKYQAILRKGFLANPPPAVRPGRKKRGRKKKTKSRNLLERFEKYRKEILAFAYDFKVPFDNNQAERDLRMMKVQQKISGTFRSADGANIFCRIRGYISTSRKQGVNVLHAIQNALENKPILNYS